MKLFEFLQICRSIREEYLDFTKLQLKDVDLNFQIFSILSWDLCYIWGRENAWHSEYHVYIKEDEDDGDDGQG